MKNSEFWLHRKQKARGCAIIGPNPTRFREAADLNALLYPLEFTLRRCIFQGHDLFLSNMSMGAGLLGAEMVIALKKEFPHIRLHGYLPCETQASNWPESYRERYFHALAATDEAYYITRHYTPGCLQQAARVMLRQASRAISLYDIAPGASHSPYPFQHATALGLDILCLLPLENPRAEVLQGIV